MSPSTLDAEKDLIDAMDELSRSDKKLSLHGRQYSPVALRVEMLRKHCGMGLSVITELVAVSDEAVIAKASISRGESVIATGFAEESRLSRGVNSSSALENAETSAIGRALANLGLIGGEYASADELTGAVSADNATVTDEQVEEIESLLEQSGRNRQQFLNWLKVDAIEDIPIVRYKTVVRTLEKAVERKQS